MNRLLTIAGPVLFVAAIAAHWVFAPSAAVRVVGTGLVLFGVRSLFVREIPVGWEGRPPSFHLRGPLAMLIGVVATAAGLGMLRDKVPSPYISARGAQLNRYTAPAVTSLVMASNPLSLALNRGRHVMAWAELEG